MLSTPTPGATRGVRPRRLPYAFPALRRFHSHPPPPLPSATSPAVRRHPVTTLFRLDLARLPSPPIRYPEMDKRTKIVTCVAAAYMLLSIMAMIIRSRKCKRCARRVHKSAAGFLNKPLLHYREMETTFGNSMATGNFVKDSSAALGREDDEGESQEEGDEVTGHGQSDGPNTQGAEMEEDEVTSRPSKKAKVAEMEEDGLVAAFKSVGENLANAIKLVAKPDNELPADLFDILNNLPGFSSAHISFYYAHLVVNPHIGKVFYKLPFEHKLNWVTMFIAEKFPGI